MSIDNHSSPVAGFRCEAVTADTIALPCLRGKSANLSHIQPADPSPASSNRDDPAVLIGLALAFVRHGPLLDGLVPEPLMLRLRALADGGNAACRLLLDWLRSRNRDLDPSWNGHPTGWATVTPPPRRSPRERVLARVPTPGLIDVRQRGRPRRRDPVQDAHTAIIAAETGGRTDG